MNNIQQPSLDSFISSSLFQEIAQLGMIDQEITDMQELTEVGRKCLFVFIQENATGPSLGLEENDYKNLTIEGEDMIPGLKGTNFLKAAKLSFEVRGM
jgi:hypothetical protein